MIIERIRNSKLVGIQQFRNIIIYQLIYSLIVIVQYCFSKQKMEVKKRTQIKMVKRYFEQIMENSVRSTNNFEKFSRRKGRETILLVIESELEIELISQDNIIECVLNAFSPEIDGWMDARHRAKVPDENKILCAHTIHSVLL